MRCSYVAYPAIGSKLDDEHPKSATLITPLEISRLVGLMSRWMKRFECRNASPDTISRVYRLMMGSARAPAWYDGCVSNPV
jgi:hypothetical protein